MSGNAPSLKPDLIPAHGGYRHLKSFQVAQVVYDVTVRFCDRYIGKRSRTHDQMVQAARSTVACALLDRQIASLEKAFLNEGGFTEKLYRAQQPRVQLHGRNIESKTMMRILSIALIVASLQVWAFSGLANTEFPQQPYPDPPNDVTRVYYQNIDSKLVPLPFEAGLVSLNVFAPAREDKVTEVRVKGPTAETVLAGDNLRFYVYVADKMDPPPHQLVKLDRHKTNRELKISVIKGRKGYAPFEEDTLKLERRLLERLQAKAGPTRLIFVNYVEIRPAAPLLPGEYAIIGDSLADMATFRIK